MVGASALYKLERLLSPSKLKPITHGQHIQGRDGEAWDVCGCEVPCGTGSFDNGGCWFGVWVLFDVVPAWRASTVELVRGHNLRPPIRASDVDSVRMPNGFDGRKYGEKKALTQKGEETKNDQHGSLSSASTRILNIQKNNQN